MDSESAIAVLTAMITPAVLILILFFVQQLIYDNVVPALLTR